MKRVAVQLPDDIYEEVNQLAMEEFEGDMNPVGGELITAGSEYRAAKSGWEAAPFWRRVR